MEETLQEVIERIFLKYLSIPLRDRFTISGRNIGNEAWLKIRLEKCASSLGVSTEICVKFWALYLRRYGIDPRSKEARDSLNPGALVGGFRRTQGMSSYALFHKRVGVSDLDKISRKIESSSSHYHRVYSSWPESEEKYFVMAGDTEIHPWWCAFHFPMIWWLGKDIVDQKRYDVLCYGSLGKNLSEVYNSSMNPYNTGFWVNYYRRHHGNGF